MFIKKLYLVHYGLTHIVLPKILYKFPLKAHFFLEFKNLFKKLYQGQYGLTHIVLSFLVHFFLFQKSVRFKKFESWTIWLNYIAHLENIDQFLSRAQIANSDQDIFI